MAATNFTPIQIYFSTTASAVPLAANLAQGELAINITDGKLYYEDNAGAVQVIATKGAGTIGGSTTQIQYNNAGALAGSAAMVFNNSTSVTTLTTLNLTNALGATFGGTAQSTYTQGDILYSSATNTLAKLGIGANTFILTSNGTIPQWVAPSSITVNTATNLAGGAAGSVPYQSGVATTTFLAIGAANRVMTSTGTAPQWVTSLTGLTGVSSSSITNTGLTDTRVVFSTTGGLETDSANLTFSGTILTSTGFAGPLNGTVGATTPAAGSFTTLGATGNVTLGDASADTVTVNGTTTFNASPVISVTDNTNAALRITQMGTGNALLVEDSTNPDSSPFMINSSGQVVVGDTSLYTSAGVTGGLQVTGSSADSATIAINSFRNSVNGPFLTLAHSKSGVNGTQTALVANDAVGLIRFSGSDGTAFIQAAAIDGFVDGTPGTNDMPGRLVFSTTADGAATLTERMRIDSAGNLGIGTAAPTAKLDVVGTAAISGAVTAGASITTGSGVSTGDCNFELGGSRTGDGNSFIDFHSSAGTDFELRIIRTSGLNGNTSITNAGTGAINLNCVGAGTMTFATTNTERMRIDSAGAVGIGGTPSAATSVDFLKNITGATTSIAVRNGGTIQSDVTGLAIGYQSTPSTVASLALTQIDFYRAQQGTIGASSTVTNQIGFNAHSSITGATNNYGVLSNIASGTNRYNFFAQGTAINYFAGVVQTNATTAIPAGGTTGAGVTVSSTNNFGVFFGSGAPTLSAAKGSLYLRSDGTTVNDRMYVNTNGSTTWTNVVTSA